LSSFEGCWTLRAGVQGYNIGIPVLQRRGLMTKHARVRTPAQMALFETRLVRPRWESLPETVRREVVCLVAKVLVEHHRRHEEAKHVIGGEGGEQR
jgi:hypothetical protein